MMPDALPGVYLGKHFARQQAPLRTGVPVFLGVMAFGGEDAVLQHEFFTQPILITSEQQISSLLPAERYLRSALSGFFRNGGKLCYLLPMPEISRPALGQSLKVLQDMDEADLLCAPDIMWAYEKNLLSESEVVSLQTELLLTCSQLGTYFAILDAFDNHDQLLEQRRTLIQSDGKYGALYYPWLRPAEEELFVPPCGHIAGIFARTDTVTGVHKAPANEVIEDVLDLSALLLPTEQQELRQLHINYGLALRARGIRVWGAYTLSTNHDWDYLTTSRLFIKIARWVARFMTGAAFENNDIYLWTYIEGYLTMFLYEAVQRGEIKNFFVRCNAETNPPDERELGKVHTEIGIAPSIPTEYIIIHITHGETGVTFS